MLVIRTLDGSKTVVPTIEVRGTVHAALPQYRDEKILAAGVRRAGEFPRTIFIAWWDHKDCTREFDGKN